MESYLGPYFGPTCYMGNLSRKAENVSKGCVLVWNSPLTTLTSIFYESTRNARLSNGQDMIVGGCYGSYLSLLANFCSSTNLFDAFLEISFSIVSVLSEVLVI